MTKLRRLNHLLGRGLAASALAGAFLLGNACEPTNSTIGSLDDPVAGLECDRAGETRSLKDGCNECTCGTDLRWACTTLACDGGSSGTSGAGGSGGSAASGGSAGSVGSGGTAGTGGSAGTGGCSAECSAPEVRWRRAGGFGAYDEGGALSGCTAYRHIRTPRDVLLPQTECSVALDCAEQSVQLALSRADVRAAFESGLLQGHDFRPIDGTVLIVTNQGKELTVGDDCQDWSPPNCIPITDGVRALVEAIKSLDRQMRVEPECTSVFGPLGCVTNADCPATYYCKGDGGFCPGVGHCEPRPPGCQEACDCN